MNILAHDFRCMFCMVLKFPTGSFLIRGLIARAVGDVTRVRVLSFENLAREIRFTDFAILRAQNNVIILHVLPRTASSYLTLPEHQRLDIPHGNSLWCRNNIECIKVFDYHQRASNTAWAPWKNTICHQLHSHLHTWQNINRCRPRNTTNKGIIAGRS